MMGLKQLTLLGNCQRSAVAQRARNSLLSGLRDNVAISSKIV